MPVAYNYSSQNATLITGQEGLAHTLQTTILGAGFTREGAAVDYTTATEPTANLTPVGSEIYRFNDQFSTTHPLYMKMTWKTYSQAAYQKQLVVELGTGVTNGELSGKFADVSLGAYKRGSSDGAVANANANGFSIVIVNDYLSYLNIERARNRDGTIRPDVTFHLSGYTGYGASVSSSNSVSSDLGYYPHRFIKHPQSANGATSAWMPSLPMSNLTRNGSMRLSATEIIECGPYGFIDGMLAGAPRLMRFMPIQHVAWASSVAIPISGEGQRTFQSLPKNPQGSELHGSHVLCLAIN